MEQSMTRSRFTKLLVPVVFSVALAGCTVVDHVRTDFSLLNAHNAYNVKNYTVAADEYRKAAALGSGEGAFMLGQMYLNGEGFKKDTSTGMQWIRQASDLNYPAADLSLGLWTLSGVNGIRRNSAEGAQLILNAAQAGDPDAMVTMGYLYMKGRGVKRDSFQASDWFQRASAAGATVQPELLTLRGVQRKMGIQS